MIARRARTAATSFVALVAGHRLFAALLVAAAAVRVVVQVAYQPALFFYGDSFAYLANAAKLQPEPIRPAGYPALLGALLAVVHNLAVVPAVQHLFGLVTGVLVYALVRRLGAGAAGACVAAAPVLFDAYQLDIEQHILSEALFSLLVAGGLVVLLWRARPSLAACAVAGVLLAAAALTRSVGLALIAPALAFAVVRGGLVRSLVLAAAFAVPLVGYAAWYSTTPQGRFALTDHDGFFLYGRVGDFASCQGLTLSRVERHVLCDPRPPADRPNPNYYVWHQWSKHYYPGFAPRTATRNRVLESFALDVIRHQPLAYARTVLGDMEHYASFGRSTGRRDEAIGEWQFHVGVPLTARHIALVTREAHRWGGSVGGWLEAQRLLRAYQRVVFTPGTLLLVALVLAVAGAAVGTGPGPVRGVRAEVLALAAAGLLLPLSAAMTSMFDYRYLLPTLPLLPAAGVLGCSALAARARALRPAQADPIPP